MGALGPDDRLVFVQTGDFRAATLRIDSGAGETFHAQKYSIDLVAGLAQGVGATTVLSVSAEDPHDETLSNGVHSIGVANIWSGAGNGISGVIETLERLSPTVLVLRFPSLDILQWAQQRNIRVLPCFADSFLIRGGLRGAKDRWRMRKLAKALNHQSIPWIGNHHIAASQTLAAIGVDPEKIVPWDWPRTPTPAEFPAKRAPGGVPRKLIYVGSVSKPKGVTDILHAMAEPPLNAPDCTLTVVGAGELDEMQQLARSLGVETRVTFTGRVPHAEVAERMHDADAVLVYSRHAYDEGLPGTIFLALASRTPLVTSDHPMFAANLKDRKDAVIVPEKSPGKLAKAIAELLQDSDLYTALSANSAEAFARLVHPVMWGDFVKHWLSDGPEDRQWLQDRALPKWSGTAQNRQRKAS